MINLLAGIFISLMLGAQPVATATSDREFDGLKGPVGSVRVEVAKVSVVNEKSAEGPRVRAHKTLYDANGELSRRITYQGEKVLSAHFFYRRSKQKWEENVYSRDITKAPPAEAPTSSAFEVFAHFFTFDEKGRRIDRSVLRKDGSLSHREEYVYDFNGRLDRLKVYDTGHPLSSIFVLTYNPDGLIVEKTHFKGTGVLIGKEAYT
jgi:hypothetical protein